MMKKGNNYILITLKLAGLNNEQNRLLMIRGDYTITILQE